MASVFLFALLLCLSSGLLTAHGQATCPAGWTQFGSRCFSFHMGPMTWTDAELSCQAVGGNLASVHSAEEHEFLRNYIKQVTGHHKTSWIGGFDAVKEGMWMWTDGSKFNYINWTTGQPDNIGGVEHCTSMNWNEEKWNDSACSDPNNQTSFVCSKIQEA
ncbi:galactose-specific lectin nattectin-like isoform X2 [Sander vitreus]